MGRATRALALALVAALAGGGCAASTRTAAAELARARWDQCDRFPGVTLRAIGADGDVQVNGRGSRAFAEWEACMFRAHRAQSRDAMAARPRPTFPAVAGWRGPLCRDGARAVRTPWDDDVVATYERIARAAAADLPRWRALVVADDLGEAAAIVCGDPDAFTIAVSARVLHEMREWPARPILIARFIAHEVAHVALGHLRLEGLDVVAMEREADELAAFYLERAGIPCRDWVDMIGVTVGTLAWLSVEAEREAIAAACELARRGERPPRRTTLTRQR
jgi:hypothetical protein